MISVRSATTLLSLASVVLGANFTLVQDYSGDSFFDAWDFYGNYDNLTNGKRSISSTCFLFLIRMTFLSLGDVTYVNKTNATNLAYVDSSGRAIIKVDNTSYVPYNDKRDSVRITSKDYFETGTIWIIDAVHLPYGCSVRPLHPQSQFRD